MYRISGTRLPDDGQRDIFVVDGRVTFEPVRSPAHRGGAPADLVAYRADPREDPSVLPSPQSSCWTALSYDAVG
jgi:hypothetical protein